MLKKFTIYNLQFTKERGFTLIELLVVISIIGILATLLVANFNAARERARDAQRKSDLRNIQTALRLYYNDTGNYACSSAPGLEILGCSVDDVCADVAVCNWGEEWSDGVRTYMSTLPADPSPGREYRYTQINGDEYTLEACLENASDDKCSGNAAWCAAGTGCIYVVEP